MPVFGECHAHLALDGADYRSARALHAEGPDEASIRRHFEEYRSRGITFLRDGGDAWGVSALAKKIAPEYGIDYRTPIFALHKNGHYGAIVGRRFSTMAEYAALVDEAAEQGADFIKVMLSGIMDFNNYGEIVAGEALLPEEMQQMVRIAHEEGFAVMAHVNGADAIIAALEAGADSIEHGNYIDRAGIELLAESNAVLVPTAAVSRAHIGQGRFNDEVLSRIAETSQSAIVRAFDCGCRIALGSDAGATGVLHGRGLADEYAFFAECIPDAQALDARLAEGERFIQTNFERR